MKRSLCVLAVLLVGCSSQPTVVAEDNGTLPDVESPADDGGTGPEEARDDRVPEDGDAALADDPPASDPPASDPPASDPSANDPAEEAPSTGDIAAGDAATETADRVEAEVPAVDALPDADIDACTPECGEAECGDDGCGGTCGECTGGKVCVDGTCECMERAYRACCDNAVCWFDSCGTEGLWIVDCPKGCEASRCVDCTSQCAGKACGEDGCGGECGQCAAGQCEGLEWTQPGACVNGQCMESGTPQTCDDGVVCTRDSCNPAFGCGAHPLRAGFCRVGGACHAAGATNGRCEQCDPAVDGSGWTYVPGKHCDDGNACTANDQCAAGGSGDAGCQGTYACDDGKPCTLDTCDEAVGCQHAVEAGHCLIDDACYSDGEVHPVDPCRACASDSSPATWSDATMDADKDGVASCAGDCDDSDPNTRPGASEACNGRDDNCDGATDEGASALCAKPADGCEGDVRVSWTGTGLCSAGHCDRAAAKTLCGYGCAAAACKACSPSCAGRTCGDDGCGGSCGACGSAADPKGFQRLTVLVRWVLASLEHMTSNQPGTSVSGGTLDGAQWYIPADLATGNRPLYSLLSPDGKDHMDSLWADEGGYSTLGIQGYPFNSAQDATCQIRRWNHPPSSDHTLGYCGEDISAQGHVLEHSHGHGYPRYGQNCISNRQVSGDEVTVGINLVAGGAVSSITWNGRQVVNTFDYARYAQTSVVTHDHRLHEAGDSYGCTDGKTAHRSHGSPVVSFDLSAKRIATKTIPLVWQPSGFGGDADHPVRWLGTISKVIDLDFTSHHVLRWTTVITPPGDWDAFTVLPLALDMTPDLSRLFIHDPVVNSLADITSLVPAQTCVNASADNGLVFVAGSVIAATPDGTLAVGIYRRSQRQHFDLCFHPGSEAWSRTHIVAVEDRNGGPALPLTFVSYVLIGSLADVQEASRSLYDAGY